MELQSMHTTIIGRVFFLNPKIKLAPEQIDKLAALAEWRARKMQHPTIPWRTVRRRGRYDFGVALSNELPKALIYEVMRTTAKLKQHRFGYELLHRGIEFWSELPITRYRVDFFIYTPKCDIIIEYDEPHHHKQAEKDERRSDEIAEYYQSCGKKVKIIRVRAGKEERFLERYGDKLVKLCKRYPQSSWKSPQPTWYGKYVASTILDDDEDEVRISYNGELKLSIPRDRIDEVIAELEYAKACIKNYCPEEWM